VEPAVIGIGAGSLCVASVEEPAFALLPWEQAACTTGVSAHRAATSRVVRIAPPGDPHPRIDTGQAPSRRTATPTSTAPATQTERSAATRPRTMAAGRLVFTWLAVRESTSSTRATTGLADATPGPGAFPMPPLPHPQAAGIDAVTDWGDRADAPPPDPWHRGQVPTPSSERIADGNGVDGMVMHAREPNAMGQSNRRSRASAWWPAVVALSLPGVAIQAASPPALDLGAFAPWDEEPATPAGYDALVTADDQSLSPLPPMTSVAREISLPSERRLYLTSIVGGSFLVVSPDNTPTPGITGGGAMGLALERSNGRLRLETEGRYRSVVEQKYLGFNENYSFKDPTFVVLSQAESSGWSVLANVWRDFRVSEQIDLYGGGGIGAAGFETSFNKLDVIPVPPPIENSITRFAWQMGVGGVWNLTDRIAVDAGYRIFGVGWTITRQDIAFGLLRGEVLVSLRIYEPFRGLLR